jgi:hypothetical protein
MKTSYWLILALIFTTNLEAQPNTNAPASPAIETPAPAPPATNRSAPAATLSPNATNSPSTSRAKKSARPKSAKADKKTATKKRPFLETVSAPLVAGPASVVASNVNVRGQAKLNSEVITRITKGQQVVVLEEIILKNSGPDEPSAWAKIILPATAHVWVHASFVDATTHAVKATKLKLRGGPGENYSMLGVLQKGDTVKEISVKGDWIEIEPPGDAYAFVAAQYLKQDATGALAASAPPNPDAPLVDTNTPAPVTPLTNETALASPPVEIAAVPTVTNTPSLDNSLTNPPAIETASGLPDAAADEPPPRRIVQHEGIVRGTGSIQAPTPFALISPDNGKPINYLHSSSASLDLHRYKGLRIIVTGEESLDERWRNTPVIDIQRIQVVE